MKLLLGTGEQPDLPGDELATLQEWRSLPDDAILSVPNAARMFAALCKQNAAALRAIFSQAVIDREVPSWVIRFDGTCDPGGYAAWVPATDVQVGPPDADGSRRFRCHLPKKAAGHLHAEATGVRPADLVALLIRRGRRVPAELRQAFSVTTPSAPAATPSAESKGAAANRGRRPARDVLTPVIDRARNAVDDPSDTAQVLAELERLARLPEEKRPAPLAGVTTGGVRWRDGGRIKTLTRAALAERLRRVAARRSTPKHAEARK